MSPSPTPSTSVEPAQPEGDVDEPSTEDSDGGGPRLLRRVHTAAAAAAAAHREGVPF